MESGNSFSLNNNSTSAGPQPTPSNNQPTENWRNNAMVVNKQKPGGAPYASANVYDPNPPRQRGGSGGAVAIAVISILIAGISLLVAFAAVTKTANIEQTPTATTASTDGYYGGNAVEFEETSIANIASKVTPAVVSIVSSSTGNSNSFWGKYYGTQSAGTGMIVTKDGYVITNKHVIDGASSIQIVTDAGDTYKNVVIVAQDPLNDVAYLKINDADGELPTVNLGDSKTIAVGQPVLAIGNALGAYQNSVTQGIISGIGRSISAGDENGANVESLNDMLQTDAAINPGNSGGPLVNAAGDVIGINTAVSTDANGLGFAIPISAAKGMLKSIIETGSAKRAYLGLSYSTVTPEIAKSNNLPVQYGAYVGNSDGSYGSAVISGGPADKAGIKDGDILTKIGDVEIGKAGSVATLIGEYKVGDTIKVTLVRNGEEKTVTVTLGALNQ